MKFKVAVTYEYESKPTKTIRMDIEAGSLPSIAAKAIRLTKKGNVRGLLSLNVVLLERLDG